MEKVLPSIYKFCELNKIKDTLYKQTTLTNKYMSAS